jgi:hypothetical protein
MPILEKYYIGNDADLMTTELNSLVNNALAISSAAYNNTLGGYIQTDIQLVVTFPIAPLVNTGISVWFLSTIDGVNYEDGSNSITPSRMPDVVIPIRPVNTLQRINRRIWLPWGNFKTLVKNEGTGQAFASLGNILSIRPITLEVG